MCGFLFDYNSETELSDFEAALHVMDYRGPDYFGLAEIEGLDHTMYFGHVRLSIMDLNDRSNQPFQTDSSVLVFNGEIYNYLELCEELEGLNVTVSRCSDTEAFCLALEHLGFEKTLEIVRGMYSFVWYSKVSAELYVARDRLGVKPCFYFLRGDSLIVSSNIDSLASYLIKIYGIGFINSSPDAVADYYKHRYAVPPKTIYKEISSLGPGKYISRSTGCETVIESLPATVCGVTRRCLNDNDYVDELEQLLISALQEQVVADVPVCLLLSGGVDSSLLAALVSKHISRSLNFVTFKHSIDDIDWVFSNKVAAELGVELIEVDKSDLGDRVFNLYSRYYDQPIACSSSLATLGVYQKLKGRYKVALVGDGADELFAGYEWYRKFFASKSPIKSSVSPRGFADALKIWFWFLRKLAVGDEAFYSECVLKRFSEEEIFQKFNCRSHGFIYSKDDLGSIKTLLSRDRELFLQMTLSRTDLSSMISGVEARVPFLDERVVAFASELPEQMLIRSGETKYLLKKLASRYFSADIVYRQKRGFGTDFTSLLGDNRAKEQVKIMRSAWAKMHVY